MSEIFNFGDIVLEQQNITPEELMPLQNDVNYNDLIDERQQPYYYPYPRPRPIPYYPYYYSYYPYYPYFPYPRPRPYYPYYPDYGYGGGYGGYDDGYGY